MPAKWSPRASPHVLQRTPTPERRTQGVALIVVLLAAVVLSTTIIAISATVSLTSRRLTVDQAVTLQAQYAAESGLARAQAHLQDVNALLNKVSVRNTSVVDLRTQATNFCGRNLDFSQNVTSCTVRGVDARNAFALFTRYIPANAEEYGGMQPAAYWEALASGTPVVSTISRAGQGHEVLYRVSYQLLPESFTFRSPNTYEFTFAVPEIRSTGEVRLDNRTVATRRIVQQVSGTNTLSIFVPSFARNFVFRNETTSTSGDPLSFGADEVFDGPVHTNTRPNFSASSGRTPTFTSEFTSCAKSARFSGYSGLTSLVTTFDDTFFNNPDIRRTFTNPLLPPRFDLEDCIALPTNSNNQKRASFGGDPKDKRDLTDAEMQTAWGLKITQTTTTTRTETVRVPASPLPWYCHFSFWAHLPECWRTETRTITETQTVPGVLPEGVYYSRGDGANTPNQATTWNNDPSVNIGGGIYVKGDVDELRLSTSSGRQVIRLRQGSTTTTFEENANGSWTVRSGNTTRTLTGKFNGMIYVDGNINDMRGDGTSAPDIAGHSKLMVTSTGRVLLKDDITYTHIPTETNKNVVNVLGIYSSGDKCNETPSPPLRCGSILADGANNRDLTIHASIMATKQISSSPTSARKGEGFGAARHNENLGLVNGRRVRLNLLGGVIEHQSQTISTGSGGYIRNYTYDPRFNDGYAPPFFPDQADITNPHAPVTWQNRAMLGVGRGIWQQVASP
ncbi:hypothetical protein [Truepera radiovictrix]|uniref:hypothetical protein n=1 Tax=Truepera radiovictrix TaxID=332249 RepID=UPI0011D117F0|nr:hypothetical protein [Truepera radiovictrix]WMT57009.1 hypothetical protein RCV51_13445 [Truepera radiovictrix]